MGERRIGGLVLALAAAANAVVVVVLWLRAGGVTEPGGAAEWLVSLGRVTGLVGAYVSLVMILLLGRIPFVDRLVGLDRLAGWHRRTGHAVLWLLLAHTALITAGYTAGDDISLWGEIGRLISTYPGVITATAALVLLIGVVVSSVVIVRRRLRYETWYFVHLYAYLAIALGFSHQLATGSEFVGDPAARAYWTALYVVTWAPGAVPRGGATGAQPAARAARRARGGRRAGRRVGRDRRRAAGAAARPRRSVLRLALPVARPLVAGPPVLLSSAPDGERLRITVKDRGDFTARIGACDPGRGWSSRDRTAGSPPRTGGWGAWP